MRIAIEDSAKIEKARYEHEIFEFRDLLTTKDTEIAVAVCASRCVECGKSVCMREERLLRRCA